MIFATDMDRTMIFSHKFVNGYEGKLCCVEYHNGKEISYMTPSSISKIKTLMQKINVIPATTRSILQFKRIEIFSLAEYAIVDNGGIILKNGVSLPNWERYIESIVCRYDLEDALKVFSNLPNLIKEPVIVDGKFIFAKSTDVDLCEEILKTKLNTKIWRLSFQGTKMYAIPMEITKGNALKFIREKLIKDKEPVYAAGDSNLDLPMLEYADYGIIPKDSYLATYLNTLNILELSPELGGLGKLGKKIIAVGTGITASDAILEQL